MADALNNLFAKSASTLTETFNGPTDEQLRRAGYRTVPRAELLQRQERRRLYPYEDAALFWENERREWASIPELKGLNSGPV